MASSAATNRRDNSGFGGRGDSTPPRIIRLWKDARRAHQRARLNALNTHQVRECRELGRTVRARALIIRRAFVKKYSYFFQNKDRIRIDVPSARAFSAVLGFLRSAATLKNPILELELSAQDIADAVELSKSQVEQVLRFLDCQRFEYKGLCSDVSAIGILHRRKRYGKGYLEGRECWLSRTSSIVLTLAGRAALGLTAGEQWNRERRRERALEKRRLVNLQRRPNAAAYAQGPSENTDSDGSSESEAAKSIVALTRAPPPAKFDDLEGPDAVRKYLESRGLNLD